MVGGRPVVFIYLTRAYFNTQAGRDAVDNLRQTMTSQFGVSPYLVGDDVFPGQTDVTRAGLWDAITDFDVYGSALQAYGSTTAGVDALTYQYQSAKQVAQTAHVGFIPAVSPGFNDSAVRSGHPAAPRYLTDVPGSAEGSLFSAELSQAALPNLDPAASNMLMVSTFNEWHEDTQIEATITANPTSVDSSGHGTYAQGYSYPGYGSLYLDLLHSATLLAGDFNVIHWNERVARSVGLPDVIAHGMLTMASAGRVVTDWVGDPGAVVEYGVRFTRPVVVPDDDTGALVELTAVVAEKRDDNLLRVDITAKSEGATVLGKAQAVVRLA